MFVRLLPTTWTSKRVANDVDVNNMSFARPDSPVKSCTQDWYSRDCGFNPPVQQHSFKETGHEIISIALLSLPLIQVGQLSVTGERMCIQCWLTA